MNSGDDISANGFNVTTLKKNLTEMELIKYIEFSAGINFKFSDELKNIRVRPKMFGTNETDPTLFDSWTFSSSDVWDNFYYADSTDLLMESHPIRVGNTSLMVTSLPTNIL